MLSRKKKIVVVVVAVAVSAVVLATVVALAVYFTLPRLDIDGGWSLWRPWSGCTQTCGGGLQYRYRSCDDPPPVGRGHYCRGEYWEERKCSDWTCPDCSRPCTSGGVLAEDCSVCMCIHSNITGRITEVHRPQLGIPDVKLYVIGREWVLATTSNPLGYYSLEGFCLNGIQISFERNAYIGVTKAPLLQGSNTRTTEMDVSLSRIEKPTFLEHPRDHSVLVGQGVRLTCKATGKPEVITYEWYKDGQLLEPVGSALFVNSAELHDAGNYSCRAISSAGKTFSHQAALYVAARAEETCEREPRSRLVSLPAGCHASYTGHYYVNYVDVGRCKGHPCQHFFNSSIKQCCAAIQTQLINVECHQFSYQVPKVVECGCQVCPHDESPETAIELSIVGEGLEPWQTVTASVEYQGQQVQIVDRTTFLPLVEYEPFLRVSVSRIYNAGTFQFLPTVKVLPTLKGKVSSHTIILQQRVAPISSTTAPNSQITVSAPWGGNLVIPPNSIIKDDGNLAAGPVNIYIPYYRTNMIFSLASAPGRFVSRDEEGQERHLKSFGVFGVHAETGQGINLHIMGSLKFSLGRERFINTEHLTDISLWELDHFNEGWVEIGNDDERRHKQHMDNRDTQTVTVPYPQPYINFDTPISRRYMCSVKIVVYSNERQQETVPGVFIQASTRDTEAQTNMGYTSSITDNSGSACLLLPCGHSHIVQAFSHHGEIQPTRHQNVSYKVDGLKVGDTLEFMSPHAESIVDDSGPFHRYGALTCERELHSHSNFFTFFTSVRLFPDLQIVEARPRHRLSWYQKPPGDPTRETCVIKAFIQTYDPRIEVVTTSQVFQDDRPVEGETYGVFRTPLRKYYNQQQNTGADSHQFSVCMEVKCPGEVRDEPSKNVIPHVGTLFKMKLIGENLRTCRETSGRSSAAGVNDWITRVNSTSTSATLIVRRPANSRFIPAGLSMATGTHNSGYLKAMQACYKDFQSVLTFNCMNEDSFN